MGEVTIDLFGGTLTTEYIIGLIGLLLLFILSPFVSIIILILFARKVILARRTKFLLTTYLLMAELLLFLLLPVPMHNSHDRKYNQAFMNWRTNQTPETSAAFAKEGKRRDDEMRKINITWGGIFGGLIILNVFGIIGLYSKRRLSKKSGPIMEGRTK